MKMEKVGLLNETLTLKSQEKCKKNHMIFLSRI